MLNNSDGNKELKKFYLEIICSMLYLYFLIKTILSQSGILSMKIALNFYWFKYFFSKIIIFLNKIFLNILFNFRFKKKS